MGRTLLSASFFAGGYGVLGPFRYFGSQYLRGEDLKTTLEAINQMQAAGIIGKYAIGGAVGATFFLEPAATLDVDIFVALPTDADGLLVSLAPIYDYLRTHGGTVQDEYIVGGWPVQFIPPKDELEREAVEESIPTNVEDINTWVMSAQHLVAIALRTGRTKDYNRILQFLEQEPHFTAGVPAYRHLNFALFLWHQSTLSFAFAEN